jgi:hypothetical protein
MVGSGKSAVLLVRVVAPAERSEAAVAAAGGLWKQRKSRYRFSQTSV